MTVKLIIIHTKGGDGVELSDLIESIEIQYNNSHYNEFTQKKG